MPSNIEIKAALQDLQTMRIRVEQYADGPGTLLEQEDTFFPVSRGRLKLRQFADGAGELIQYQRPDTSEAKQSIYQIYKAADPDQLKQTLQAALGISVVVKKRRWLYFMGQTRVHLDSVEGLGDFIELEVVLRETQSAESGKKTAESLMQKLNIHGDQCIDTAYADLLLRLQKNQK